MEKGDREIKPLSPADPETLVKAVRITLSAHNNYVGVSGREVPRRREG